MIEDPAFHAGDPHATYTRWRREDPVHRDDDASLWVLTRHEDVARAARDPATFCSGRGVLLGDRDREVVPSQSILFLDPPEHSRYRKVVASQFHGRQVAELEPRIRDLAVDLLDRIEPGEPFDAVSGLATPLPLLLIAGMLGLDDGDLERLAAWSDACIAAAVDPTEEAMTVGLEAAAYLWEAMQARKADPGDDLLSTLLVAEVEGERLAEDEVLGFCMSLLVAGNETTRHLISGGLLALAERPEQWERLREEPSLLPTAVEELLRWVTPFIGFCRTATRDVEVDGTTIPADDYVLLALASANRDHTVFGPTADQLDVGRDPNHHLAFGFGPHYCLGAQLARMEARVVLTELLGRATRIELVGEPVHTSSSFVNGLESLPLVVR